MKKLFITLLVFIAFKTNAQTFTNYTSPNNITCIAVAGDNDYWMGTLSGVVHYVDGNWILNDSINGKKPWFIIDIVIDTEENIWIESTDGICYFNGSVWKDATPSSYHLALDGELEIDGAGNVWAAYYSGGNYAGIARYNGVSWTEYTQADIGLTINSVKSITIDKNDNVWVSCGAAAVFNGFSWSTLTHSDGLINNCSRDIAIDSSDNIWFATSQGVYMYDSISWTYYSTTDGLASNDVKKIVAHSDNSIWCTTSVGISVNKNGVWTNYDNESGMTNDFSYCIKEDESANILVGSDYGIQKFDGSNWSSIYQENTLANCCIIDILVDQNNRKWISTSGAGISVLDNRSWINYNTSNVLPSNSITSLVKDDADNIWIGTDKGLVKYDGANWTNYTISDGLISDHITDVAIDQGGNLWCGTSNGISKFNGVSWLNYTTTDGLVHNSVNELFVDNSNTLWIGTYAGISEFNGTSWDNYKPSSVYGGNNICSIEQDADSNLWFGTNQDGVYEFDHINWIHHDTIDGSRVRWVYAIERDPLDNMWFGAFNLMGIKVFDGINWTSYTMDDGLIDVNILAIAFDSIGNKWIGTARGLSMLNEGIVNSTIKLSPDTLICANSEEYTDTLVISCTQPWEISCDAPWFTISENEGTGDDTVIITISKNTSPIDRSSLLYLLAYDVVFDSVFIYQAGATSMMETNNSNSIKYYPNPVADKLYISYSTIQSEVFIKIFSSNGELKYSMQTKGNPIEIGLTNIPKGIYLIQIINDNIIEQFKIIKFSD
jgi:ligand-binding sensor domain-containing protein